MRSTLVEFARFKNLQTGILRKEDEYLRTIENHPVCTVLMQIDQRPFNKLMHKLRYGKASEPERLEALKELSELVSRLLQCHENDDRQVVDGPLPSILKKGKDKLQQIDLVANATEISALPFEAALFNDDCPYFLYGEGIVLTRRVRGAFQEDTVAWPVKPRVLFAWSAAGGEVPHQEHREALLEALDPWLPPRNIESVFVEIDNAKCEDIEKALENENFTHFHLLAHGQAVEQDDDVRFGIALNHSIEGTADVVTPEEFSKTLTGIRSSAVVMTLAACDAANQTDIINPENSIAHQLHIAGCPVVIASQLPLTIFGSNILVRYFYGGLFEGLDVREALHRTRVELYKKRKEAGHDWVSLVGYVQLHEGYAGFLEEVRLKSQLCSLVNLRDRAEVLAENVESKGELWPIREQLKKRIESLENLLLETQGGKALEENRGLLGSAEKRLAEVYFRHYRDSNDEASKCESRKALKRARDWYHTAFVENPSHHWSGVQYLALNAALTGEVDSKDWKTACYAAEVDRVRPTEYWAHGSLAELALLGQIIDKKTDETAESYLREMKKRVADIKGDIPVDPFRSTELQLRRYVDWWRRSDGFFSGASGMAKKAEQLANMLTR